MTCTHRLESDHTKNQRNVGPTPETFHSSVLGMITGNGSRALPLNLGIGPLTGDWMAERLYTLRREQGYFERESLGTSRS